MTGNDRFSSDREGQPRLEAAPGQEKQNRPPRSRREEMPVRLAFVTAPYE